MRQGDERWAAQLPDLFREAYVGYADARVRCTTEGLVEDLVSRLHLVAVKLLEEHDPAHADVVRHARAMGLLGPG